LSSNLRSAVPHSSSRRLRLAELSSGLVFLALVVARPALAQVEDPRWRSTAEIGGSIGGNWLEGKRAPTVASRPGFLAGLGIERGMTPYVASGVSMRVMTSNVELEEVGTTWKGGRLVEVNVMATTSLQSRRRTALRTSLDLLGGVAIVNGARDIVPFRDAANISPAGEIGLSLRHGVADADASRPDDALFVRYSVVRLRMATPNAIASSGAVGRIVIGLRIAR
jgi:hypothetical protein